MERLSLFQDNLKHFVLCLRFLYLLFLLQVTQFFLVIVAVMVNFVCQLDWAAMARYLDRHYSGCFCEDGFWIILTLKYLDLE